ncbi:MAG: DUF89 family protein, partial [Eubacterium sp.]|nr:DUF89 family protein [Eubacterium sp.]
MKDTTWFKKKEEERIVADCLGCLSRTALRDLPDDVPEKKKMEYATWVCGTLGKVVPQNSAPDLSRKLHHKRDAVIGDGKDFSGIKSYFNKKMMGLVPEIRSEIRKAEDPLLRAIRYSLCGNIIDFSVPQGVTEEMIRDTMAASSEMPVDPEKVSELREQLQKAGNLLLVTDNCGEIVFDKLLLEEVKREYPHLKLQA